MNVLDIKDPRFLKKMKIKDLELLSIDIRNFIIDKVSLSGGHLSSNLGITDLTIAIHKVFNSPRDKIIFDVSHQCYPHKILTGRAKDFDKLRKLNGLSGFQKRSESQHDAYEAGHSSTSISAALGMALARDKQHKKYHVVAVIGELVSVLVYTSDLVYTSAEFAFVPIAESTSSGAGVQSEGLVPFSSFQPAQCI